MPAPATGLRIAILDDYQGVALSFADWAPVQARADITVFGDTSADEPALVERLRPFDVLCVMRERTPLPRRVLKQLPKLRLIVSTGARNASIDGEAAAERGIAIVHTGYTPTPTVELTWGLILSAVRNLNEEAGAVRTGGWQRTVGMGLHGRTLGVLGLGRLGSEVARIGRAFGMHTIAWSPNLTTERAAAAGAELVGREALFERSDVLSIHLVLSQKTRGIVDAAALARMKPTAYLVNASRGPLVDEAALLAALRQNRLAGAALDTFDIEPLPADHPFRTEPRLLATPHIGYVADDQYRIFYGDTVRELVSWLDSAAA
jgi:phosphoglycerate dehydrogenase-like enzyme